MDDSNSTELNTLPIFPNRSVKFTPVKTDVTQHFFVLNQLRCSPRHAAYNPTKIVSQDLRTKNGGNLTSDMTLISVNLAGVASFCHEESSAGLSPDMRKPPSCGTQRTKICAERL